MGQIHIFTQSGVLPVSVILSRTRFQHYPYIVQSIIPPPTPVITPVIPAARSVFLAEVV